MVFASGSNSFSSIKSLSGGNPGSNKFRIYIIKGSYICIYKSEKSSKKYFYLNKPLARTRRIPAPDHFKQVVPTLWFSLTSFSASP